MNVWYTARDVVDRPQGRSELSRVAHASDLEVVGRRERQVIGEVESLGFVAHRVVPGVR